MKKSSSRMLCLEITKCNNAINQTQDKTKQRNGHSAILRHLITPSTCGGASVIGAGIATFICCDVRPSSISKEESGGGAGGRELFGSLSGGKLCNYLLKCITRRQQKAWRHFTHRHPFATGAMMAQSLFFLSFHQLKHKHQTPI